MDRNMIQGGCGFPGSRTMIEPNQRPYHKVSEIFNELKLQPLGGKRKNSVNFVDATKDDFTFL